MLLRHALVEQRLAHPAHHGRFAAAPGKAAVRGRQRQLFQRRQQFLVRRGPVQLDLRPAGAAVQDAQRDLLARVRANLKAMPD